LFKAHFGKHHDKYQVKLAADMQVLYYAKPYFCATVKATCVSILFICVTTATFSKWLVIASFAYNQRYIANQLCVNRNNPNSACKGHCFLSKQLDKEDKPEGANGSAGKEKFEVQLFFVDTVDEKLNQTVPALLFPQIPHHFAEQRYIKQFFHPPSA